jgi:mannose-6-phosphate isomerase-like protein (cupin superfamily)
MSDILQRTAQISAGKDRFKEDNLMIWGLLPLTIKLSGKDTNGEVLLFEHRNMGKGGPPRHIHFTQDEWFYVIKGEYVFEVGDDKYQLTSGDTLFAPRNITHGWANVGDEPGTLLTMVSPVGDFETFILDTTKHAELPSPEEIEKAFADHGMKVVGPPLAVDCERHKSLAV